MAAGLISTRHARPGWGTRTAATIALVLAAGGVAALPAAGADTAGATATTRTAQHTSPVPSLGPNVLVVDPSMSVAAIKAVFDGISEQQVGNQFGDERYAILLEPGTYGSATDPLNVQVGYYTQVAGLGVSPTDVVVHGTINVYNQCDANGCIALDNFWRSLSNLTIDAAGGEGCYASTEFWAVSQAAPMRRVNVTGGTLSLMDYCTAGPQYASGGFIADSAFSGGAIVNGSQQQFMVRNSDLVGWSNGVWNQVFVGDNGAPAQSFGQPGADPYTTVERTPVVRETPYLTRQATGSLAVVVPSVRTDSVGTSWASGSTPGRTVSLRDFFVASPSTPVRDINRALLRGRNLLLLPGVYHLDRPILVSRPDTVVMGLGFATLVPMRGATAITVATPRGVTVTGLILDAGPRTSDTLLRVGGVRGVRDGRTSAADPTLVSDVFVRVGGAAAGRVDTAVTIAADHTIIDDVWAWRADHGAGVGWTVNTARTGLAQRGDDVTAYGLFVEHFQKTEVSWSGNRGEVYFFQNEMPYDVPSQGAWNLGHGVLGYPAFVVDPRVRTFQGWGMGSYSFFNQGLPIESSMGFRVPDRSGVALHDVFTRFLDGSGSIDSVVNGTGAAVTATDPGPANVVSYP